MSGLGRYEKVSFLGEGQFATVYLARDKEWSESSSESALVAVKKIKLGSRAETEDGIHRTALREIKLLRELQSHPNVIRLRDVFGHQSEVSLVMDFMDTDLEIIVKDTSIILTAAHIKAYLLQTLLGLDFLHHNFILHRDLKPNNLLVDRRGVLKLADFGLARSFATVGHAPYTHVVVTRWYRCPELLFGARRYSVSVDMWAVGCILAELLLRVPFLPGDSDLDQLAKIFQALGTPTEDNWKGLKSLPDYLEFKKFPGTPLKQIFTAATPDLLALLQGLLTMDPKQRFDCTQALKSEYFRNKPYACPGELLPLPKEVKEKIESEDNTDKHKNKAGKKRKLRDGIETSGLAKKLVF